MKPAMLRKYMAGQVATPAVASPAALVDVTGYPGSKGAAGTWQRIIGQMPPHSVYVEPFFGSGQIFHRKRRSPSSILIDCNPRVI